jgi:hypothetical protein
LSTHTLQLELKFNFDMLKLKSYMSDKKKRVRNKIKTTSGRPPSKIDWDEVKESLLKGCTVLDIAAEQGVYDGTLREACRREQKMQWTEFCSMYRHRGDALLRKKQFDSAMSGDRTLLVWLGKQRLDQRDTPAQAISEEQKKGFENVIATLDALRNPR